MRALAWLVALAFPLAATQGPEGTAAVRGRLVDAITGRPIRNVVITFKPERRTPYAPGIDVSLPRRMATTDPRGGFEIANLAAADYSIYTSGTGDYLDAAYGARGPAALGRPLTVAEGARLEITVSAWPAASIAGRVVDERGRPVTGATVQLVSRLGQSYGSSGVDDRGEYAIARLPPGEYTVGVQVSLMSRTLAPPAPPRGPSDYVPPLEPYLVDRGARTVLTTYGAPLPPSATTARPNVYVTSYYGGSTNVAGARYFPLSVGEARSGVELVLKSEPAFRLAGVATGPDGPVPGLFLTLLPDGVAESYRNGRITATAAADGAFVFVGVPAGGYKLRAYRREPALTEVSVASSGALLVAMDDVIMRDPEALWAEVPIAVGGEDVDGVAVMLRRGTTISGRTVMDDQTEPAFQRGAPRVGLGRIGSESAIDDPFIQIKSDGTFSAKARPERYLLNASASPQGWYFKTARLGGRDIGDGPLVVGDSPIGDLELVYTRAKTQIRGNVADSHGLATSDASVMIFPADPGRWDRVEEFDRGRLVRLTAPGYEISGLMPGDYLIAALDAVQRTAMTRASFERLARVAARVTLRTGEPVTLNLTVASEKQP